MDKGTKRTLARGMFLSFGGAVILCILYSLYAFGFVCFNGPPAEFGAFAIAALGGLAVCGIVSFILVAIVLEKIHKFVSAAWNLATSEDEDKPMEF